MSLLRDVEDYFGTMASSPSVVRELGEAFVGSSVDVDRLIDMNEGSDSGGEPARMTFCNLDSTRWGTNLGRDEQEDDITRCHTLLRSDDWYTSSVEDHFIISAERCTGVGGVDYLLLGR